MQVSRHFNNWPDKCFDLSGKQGVSKAPPARPIFSKVDNLAKSSRVVANFVVYMNGYAFRDARCADLPGASTQAGAALRMSEKVLPWHAGNHNPAHWAG